MKRLFLTFVLGAITTVVLVIQTPLNPTFATGQPSGSLAADARLQPKQPEPQKKQNPQLKTVSPTVSAKLSESAANVRTLQNVLTRVEKAKYLKDQDVKELETAMSATAEALYAAFNQATSEAQEASKSEGAAGSVGSLEVFEREANVQLAATRQIESRLKTIQKRVESKTYRMDESMDQSLNQTAPEQTRTARRPALYAWKFVNSFAEVSCEGSNLASTAMPSLGVPCISPCRNQQWSACLSCILSKLPAAGTAYNNFKSCWNGASSPWKAIKQAACLVKFIAILA